MTLENKVYAFVHYALQMYKKNVLGDHHTPFNIKKANIGIKFILLKKGRSYLLSPVVLHLKINTAICTLKSVPRH